MIDFLSFFSFPFKEYKADSRAGKVVEEEILNVVFSLYF